MATQNITLDTFEGAINDNDIAIFDFWASWCGPCRNFAPTFEAASEKYDDILFGKIDTEAERQLAGTLQIRSIPTLMIFREQILVFNQAGALPGHVLDEIIGKVKELDMDEVRAEIESHKASKA